MFFKNKVTKSGAVAGLLLFSTLANAEAIRLDEYVTLMTSGTGSPTALMHAFPTAMNCNIWKYVPGHQTASGHFVQRTSLSRIKVGDQPEIGAVAALQMRSVSDITSADVLSMKQLIAEHLQKASTECARPNAVASEIELQPALGTISNIAPTGKEASYSEIRSSAATGDLTIRQSLDNPSRLTYLLDAADDQSLDGLKSLVDLSAQAPVQIGKLRYALEGVLNQIDSKLTFSGAMSASFKSALVQTTYNVSTSQTTLSPSDGATAVITKGVSLPGAGGLGASVTSNQTSSNFEVKTALTSGSYGVKITFDHGRSRFTVDDKPIMIRSCNDEKHCAVQPLADFVEAKLLEMFLQSSYTTVVEKLQNGTFNVSFKDNNGVEHDNGRQGDAKTDFSVNAEYMRRFDGHYLLDAEVYANQLSAGDLKPAQFDTPVIACAQKNYLSQLNLFSSYLALSPLPIAKECLK